MNFGEKTYNGRQLGRTANVANNLRNINFDPTVFTTFKTASGLYVSSVAEETSEATPFLHQFKTTTSSNNANVYSIASGDWVRNGDLATMTNVADIDPLTDNIIPADYDGDVYNYVTRVNSSGGEEALELIVSGVPIPTSDNQVGMEKLISVVTYEDGAVSSISQNIVGDKDDESDTGGYVGDYDEFGLIVFKPTKYTTAITVNGGVIRRRDEEVTAALKTENPIGASKKVYLLLESSSGDPSLIPETATIKVEDAFPAYSTYQKDIIKLYDINFTQITLDAPGGSSGLTYDVIQYKQYQEGSIYDDWVRPDGKESGNATLDANVPKAQTLNFITGGDHEGELQDYNYWELVCSTGDYITGDKVISYCDHDQGGTDTKAYSYIDSHQAVSHYVGRSLEVTALNTFQIYGFAAGSPNETITDATIQLNGSNYYYVLGRSAGDTPTLTYLDLSGMKVADSFEADHADNADNADYADEAGHAVEADHATTADTIDGDHPHDNHTGLDEDDHEQYLLLSGDKNRNTMGGVIGNTDGTLLIDPSNRKLYSDISSSWTVDWQNGQLHGGSQEASIDWYNKILYDGAAKCLEWGTGDGENILSHKPWTVTVTTAAGSETGCFILDGGLYSAKGIYSDKGTSNAAGIFDDNVNSVTLCDGTNAGFFDDGVSEVTICSGSNVYSIFATQDISSSTGFDTEGVYSVWGTQVLTVQQPSIADASNVSGTATTNGVGFVTTDEFNNFVTGVNEGFMQLNALISSLETHGIIAS